MQFGPAPRRALSYSFQSRQRRGCLAHWLSLQRHSSPAGGHVELTAHNPTFRAHLDALAYRTPPDERSSCRRVFLSFLVDGRSSGGRRRLILARHPTTKPKDSMFKSYTCTSILISNRRVRWHAFFYCY